MLVIMGIIMILDVQIFQKKDGKYHQISEDYITNNEEQEENNISLQSYASVAKKKQYRLEFADRIEDVEYMTRENASTRWLFVINHSDKRKEIPQITGYTMIKGKKMGVLEGYEVQIYEKLKQ